MAVKSGWVNCNIHFYWSAHSGNSASLQGAHSWALAGAFDSVIFEVVLADLRRARAYNLFTRDLDWSNYFFNLVTTEFSSVELNVKSKMTTPYVLLLFLMTTVLPTQQEVIEDVLASLRKGVTFLEKQSRNINLDGVVGYKILHGK